MWSDYIRPVTKADAARLLDIYSYYVTDTAITFEYDLPTVEEFEGWIESITKKKEECNEFAILKG